MLDQVLVCRMSVRRVGVVSNLLVTILAISGLVLVATIIRFPLYCIDIEHGDPVNKSVEKHTPLIKLHSFFQRYDFLRSENLRATLLIKA